MNGGMLVVAGRVSWVEKMVPELIVICQGIR